MDNAKIKTQFIFANFATMKYISLVMLGFSLFFLITDFFFSNIINHENLYFYRILDIAISIISLSAIYFYWYIKPSNTFVINTANFIYVALFLSWAAIISGIDFKTFGLSTFIIALLSSTFYLYISIIHTIILYAGSCLLLLFIMSFRGGFETEFFPMLTLLVPTSVFCIMINSRNYRNKINDIENQEKIIEINKNLEIEVIKRTEQIQTALKKAEESDHLKTAFLDNMSHEIRTPLNAIAGFSELITSTRVHPEKIKQYSNIIDSSCKKIIQVIDDVIEISEIQTNQVKIVISEFNFELSLNTIISSLKTKAEIKNIVILVENEIQTTETTIKSDKKKIEAIIRHLIENAIKFTIQGAVKINYRIHKEQLGFSVSDTGIGISDENKKIIFEPFRQADIGINREFGGNGLGLAVTRAYVEMLHGTVTVSSEIAKGSSFEVTIPLGLQQSNS